MVRVYKMNDNKHIVFPFAAIAGQDRVKKALLLNAVNPKIGGVIISGEKGTAKSTMVRGLADVMVERDVINLPLHITEDRLIGTMKMTAAVVRGEKVIDYGLLYDAHGHILYVDEINLLSEHLANCILQVSSSGMNRIEREGMSYSHASNFILVGTMNPEEGLLRPHFMDRFGLYVESKGSLQVNERKMIIKRRLAFEKEPLSFMKAWEKQTHKLTLTLLNAIERLASIDIKDEQMDFVVSIVQAGNCAGHRADIVMVETAKAIAAWHGHTRVTKEDIEEAASYCLPHRIRPEPPHNKEEQSIKNKDNDVKQDKNNAPIEDTPGVNDTDSGKDGNEHESAESDTNNHLKNSSMDTKDKVEQSYLEGHIPIDMPIRTRRKAQGTGKRTKVKTDSRKGRYIKATMKKEKNSTLAFDATLKTALPYQRWREHKHLKVVIKSTDFRFKVKEKRTGCTLLFVVDASGSMGTKQRMRIVKGTILSMLNDAYQKRDKVGMIAFRKDQAELILGITKSVERAQKELANIPTGGKTPLAAGLYAAYDLLKHYKMKEPDAIPLLILVSDGKANVAFNTGNPVEDALHTARMIKNEGIQALVVDTESGFIQLGIGKKIAQEMDAQYYKLEDLGVHQLQHIIGELKK